LKKSASKFRWGIVVSGSLLLILLLVACGEATTVPPAASVTQLPPTVTATQVPPTATATPIPPTTRATSTATLAPVRAKPTLRLKTNEVYLNEALVVFGNDFPAKTALIFKISQTGATDITAQDSTDTTGKLTEVIQLAQKEAGSKALKAGPAKLTITTLDNQIQAEFSFSLSERSNKATFQAKVIEDKGPGVKILEVEALGKPERWLLDYTEATKITLADGKPGTHADLKPGTVVEVEIEPTFIPNSQRPSEGELQAIKIIG
jgi:hypothetical protein